MAITVKFFASLREEMGRSELSLEYRPALTVAEVWTEVCPRPMADEMLSAVNLEYVEASHPVGDGDEVAFFPPVTGG